MFKRIWQYLFPDSSQVVMGSVWIMKKNCFSQSHFTPRHVFITEGSNPTYYPKFVRHCDATSLSETTQLRKDKPYRPYATPNSFVIEKVFIARNYVRINKEQAAAYNLTNLFE